MSFGVAFFFFNAVTVALLLSPLLCGPNLKASRISGVRPFFLETDFLAFFPYPSSHSESKKSTGF